MSRFNTTIILACVLLAMLLWIVRATVGEWTDPAPVVVVVAANDEPEDFPPSLPVLNSGSDIATWLAANRMSNAAARNSLDGYRNWMDNRGFPVASAWYSAGASAAGAATLSLPDNDAQLLALAAAGNARAALTLGERSLQDDPLAALEWFDQAIVNGSLWAMIRSADLLTTLGDPALAEFRSGEAWGQTLAIIQAEEPPLERALAWNIAAVIAGGYAVVDATHADRISELSNRLDAAQIDNACELAQGYVLDTATARRAQGGAVFSTERPLFAVSTAQPENILPCDVPVQPLVDMSDCLTDLFVGPGRQLWQMYFCPSS